MFRDDNLEDELDGSGLEKAVPALISSVANVMRQRRHGHFDKWLEIIDALPALHSSVFDFNADRIVIGSAAESDAATRQALRELLLRLQPWRKGPFEVFGVTIDSEWRSNMKWRRLQDHIRPLSGRTVLDVGCGNGYYIYRMLGAGAKFVLGIEPSQLFMMQFNAIRKYTPGIPATVLPLRFDELPLACFRDCNVRFDTVFSMGVLYHRKQPERHLSGLMDCLKPGGELVLETLIIEGGEDDVLAPDATYAKMSNVWSIPSPIALAKMLGNAGFTRIRTIGIYCTDQSEQRRTDWMTGQSLSDFLDPVDPGLTVEGYPAPRRIIISCSR